MSAAAQLTVDQYLRLTGKPYAEFRHGEVTRKPLPTKLHALVQKHLIRLLEDQALARLGFQAYPELTVRLSPTKFLIPDVCVTADFPGPYPTSPVHLCCEILSPDDHIGALLAKCEEYHAWGVPHCWLIDPQKRTAWQYHRNGEPQRVAGQLRAGELAVTWNELLALLPE